MAVEPSDTPDPGAGPRLRSDAERNRRRIVAAAREAFAESGLDVPVDEIARRAGVGVGTLYRRFPTRDALIEALFEDRMAAVVDAAREAAADPDPWRGLVAFLEGLLAMQASDRAFSEIALAQPDGCERLAGMREQMRPLVDDLVSRARADGRLRPDAEATDIALVSAMVSSVGDLAHSVSPELWRRALGIVLDGLRSRRDAPSALPAEALEQDELAEAMRCRGPRPR